MTLLNRTSHTEPAINFSELLTRVEDDHELLQDLIAMFRDEYPLQRQALQAAMDAADGKQLHAIGHTLKGMFANLAMTPAAQAAARIEQACEEPTRSEANAAELQLLLTALDKEIVRIFAELDTSKLDAHLDTKLSDVQVPDAQA